MLTNTATLPLIHQLNATMTNSSLMQKCSKFMTKSCPPSSNMTIASLQPCQSACPANFSWKWLFWGSLVMTSKTLTLVAAVQPLGFRLTFIIPSPPGGIVLSNPRTQDPQPGRTLLICRTPVPLLAILNSCTLLTPSSEILPRSNDVSKSTRAGIPSCGV